MEHSQKTQIMTGKLDRKWRDINKKTATKEDEVCEGRGECKT